ncbi:MAG TPA: hypothetical protein VHR65_01125 [Solirubrobacterales bacterium]|jgi:hypothetical protein|nr:hypothetical protein [Solirubrobacterales bacterium]
MLGRRRIDTSTPLRSSLSSAAFAVEERVVWGGADAVRGIVDVVKWPFERAIWAIERGLVWPLEERTGDWSGPLRSAGVAALALLAVGAGVFGLLWASGSGGATAPQTRSASAPADAPVVAQASKSQVAQAAPVLHGATPDFKHVTGGISAGAGTAATRASSEAPGTSAPVTAESSTTASTSSSSSQSAAAKVEPAGPAATKVGRQFAGAFVLYETGSADAKVRAAFAATATPQLGHSLLRRPPRLPANVKVPRATVLNLVPGPKHGETYTLSVALLRVGVTSELRIDMQRDKKTGEWRVTDVLG